MKCKIFSMGGIQAFCETPTCYKPASYFLGTPDGPINTHRNLCEQCKTSLIDSIIQEEGQAVVDRANAAVEAEKTAKSKDNYGGREFTCEHCGEVFYSPQQLGAHVKSNHGKKGGEG